MATNLDELIISLKADISGLRSSLRTATGDVIKFNDRAKKEVSSLDGSIDRLQKRILTLGTAWAAFRVGKSVVDAGMQMQALQNQMMAATTNSAVAADAMAYVRAESERLGLQFTSTAEGFAKFATSSLRAGLTLQENKDIFTGVSEAATALRISTDRVGLVFTALGQMANKGKVNMEELGQQLGDSLPGAVQIFSKALGVSTAEFYKMVTAGQVLLPDLRRLGNELHEQFGVQAVEAANSAQAAFNRLDNALFELKSKAAAGGFLDSVTDSVNDLKELLNKPETLAGLQTFVNFLGQIANLAVQAAAWTGTLIDKLGELESKAVDRWSARLEALRKSFAGELVESAVDRWTRRVDDAIDRWGSRIERVKALLADDAPLPTGPIGPPAPKVWTVTSPGRVDPDFTLGKISPPGETDAQKNSRKKAERARQAASDALQGFRYDMLGDEGSAMARLDQQQKVLEEALEQKLITEQEYRDLNLQAEIKYQEELEKIRKKALEKQEKTIQAGLEGFLNTKIKLQDKTLKKEGKSFRDSITQAANYNKTMFQISKAAALAEALLAARQSVVDAYRFGNKLGGPPLGAVFAGVAAAAQAANIAAIASTSFGGGGSVSTSSGGGTSTTSSASEAITGGTSRNVYITLSGDDDALFSKNTVRKLIEQISDAVGDGSSLRVSVA